MIRALIAFAVLASYACAQDSVGGQGSVGGQASYSSTGGHASLVAFRHRSRTRTVTKEDGSTVERRGLFGRRRAATSSNSNTTVTHERTHEKTTTAPAEEKKTSQCDCAKTGVCTCDPATCTCPNCPEHHGEKKAKASSKS